MSAVLWSNLLEDGKVSSDQSDKPALYKHADKLDAITRKLGLASVLDICDSTDVLFDDGDFELPEGVESTDEIMAKERVWISTDDAEKLLTGLLTYIQQQQVRFGAFSKDHAAVAEELTEALKYVTSTKAPGAHFNFSIVT